MGKDMERTFKIQELESVVRDFLNFVVDKRVLGFSGNLGAGKTTFTKEVLKRLGYEGEVPSPTFVLRRDYDLGEKKVIHIDAYRLENPEQISQVVSREELEDRNNLVIIEWPELVDPNIFDAIFLFEHVDETTRRIKTQK